MISASGVIIQETKVKVLLVNLRIGTGSVGRIVSDLYHGIVDSGNVCKVAYARGGIGDIPAQDVYRICDEREARIHAGLTRVFGNTALYHFASTKRFCDWIDRYKPDVVHIHGVYGYYLDMQALFEYFAKNDICVISTLHSCWDFTGHCCYFDYVGCDQWKTGCKKCQQKSSYPRSSFLDDTAKNYQRKKALYGAVKRCTIVTPSKWLADLAKESFLSSKKIEVIHNGVDLNAFHYKDGMPDYIDNAKPVILCVANIWERRKGWQDVVGLSKLLPDDIQLAVVGASKSQKKELGDRTIAIRRTNSKDELAMLYSHSTVFFNPTYEDNYPTVNLEASACRLPVITYKTGGSPEILEFGNWGKVIDHNDYDALIDYTRKVFSGEISMDFSGVEALGTPRMVNEYMDLYHAVSQA